MKKQNSKLGFLSVSPISRFPEPEVEGKQLLSDLHAGLDKTVGRNQGHENHKGVNSLSSSLEFAMCGVFCKIYTKQQVGGKWNSEIL